MKKILILVLIGTILAPLTSIAEEQLAFAVLITRHGDRAPFAKLDKIKYDWGTGEAELTPIGMHQEYTLGKNLRTNLIDNKKLLPLQYKENSIFTLASDTNRTIMSAQSLLMGLYPPGTGPALENKEPALPDLIQVIPVRSLPAASSLILTPYPEYLKLLAKYVYPTKKWKEKEVELAPKMKEWSEAAGYDIKNLNDVLTVGDVLTCAKSHNFPYPAGLSAEAANEIMDVTSLKLAAQFHVGALSYSMGGELFNRIAGDISDFIDAKKEYKLVYYSGHDITILPVLSLLGKPLDKAPGYASHMLIELYKDIETSAYSVKVIYNYDYVKLPAMQGSDSMSYEDFVKLVNSVNAEYKDLNRQACGDNKNQKKTCVKSTNLNH